MLFWKFPTLPFIFNSLIHSELTFVWGVILGFLDWTADVPLLQYKLWKVYFLHCTALYFYLKITWVYLCESISGFSILFHWSMCLSLHQYHTFNILKLGRMIPPIIYFFQDCFSYSNSLPFYVSFTIILYISTKYLPGILIEIMLKLCIWGGELISFYIEYSIVTQYV